MFRKLFFLNCLFLFFGAFCYADVPNEIRYNGKLKEYKIEVNGIKQMNFKLYPVEIGGTALWESGPENIKVSSGIFTYVIKPSMTQVDWRNKDIYLEIEIDGKKLEPREKLLAVPYSLHSNTTESASVKEGTEFFVTVGNSKNFSVDKDNVKFINENGVEFYMVPKGAIIIWSGSADKIPTGWALCDGTNGTPDLRGKFVLGSFSETGNKYSVGQTGGEEEHTLTIDEMPSHNHTWLFGLETDDSGTGGSLDEYTRKPGNITDSIGYVGGSRPHNNMPPYYSLCYIMKK
ncbi:hypothetical protein [Candidatus Ruminimicrobium bovinum]|uniref:hypothetical protein n=1 Tax=Candidatus Ruminimicrobium bovinum TaxID=3242779 RepID=UPI0039B9AC28